jgi:hypothetical protein
MDNMDLSYSGDELEAVLGIRSPRRNGEGAGQGVVVNSAKTPPLQHPATAYQLALALLRSMDRQGNSPADDANARKTSFDESYHDLVDDQVDDNEKQGETTTSVLAAAAKQ